jgi:membrane fusion protein (multidrug efflux system)
MKPIRRYILLLLTLLVLNACSDQVNMISPESQIPPSVSVMTLSSQSIEFSMTLPGRVTPFRQSQVRPQVDGVVTNRLFEEGAQVKQGQQLYQIDDSRYAARFNSAIADLQSVEANLKAIQAKSARYKDLVSRNAVSQQEYDDVIAQTAQAQAAISVADAAVAVAKINLDYTKVYAPIDGQISRSYITEGALVTTNQAQQLATITQLDPVYIDMQESGKAVLELRQEMRKHSSLPVSVLVDETRGNIYEHKGDVKFSEVTVDQSTGSVTLRAIVPNPDSILLPGLFVKGRIDTGTINGVLVPQRATMRQPNGAIIVYVVNDKKIVELREIQPVNTLDGDYAVTSGLESGEQLIVVGYQKVKPGEMVNAVPWLNAQSNNANRY